MKSSENAELWWLGLGVVSLTTSIYSLICMIRGGKRFNGEYYQQCLLKMENQTITEKEKGTSIGKAIVFLVVVSLCAGLLGGVCGGVISRAVFEAFMSGMEDPIWSETENPTESQTSVITSEALIGRWELQYAEDGDEIYSYEVLKEQGYSDERIEAYFSGMCFHFFEDSTLEVFSWDENGNQISKNGTWIIQNDQINISESGSKIISTGTIKDGLLYVEEGSIIMRFERVSTIPSNTPSAVNPDVFTNYSIEN